MQVTSTHFRIPISTMWVFAAIAWVSMSMACEPPKQPCGGGCPVDHVCIEDKVCLKVCTKGQVRCQGKCVDTTSNISHCGQCGNACKNKEYCKDKQCIAGVQPPTCDTGLTACGAACIDLQNSTKHCGACGNACKATQVCIVGTCADTCQAGQVLCNNACVDLAIDSNNCGSCARACPQSYTCKGGRCECPAGQTDCLGTCIDLQNNQENCGKCLLKCDAGRRCNNGTCTCPVGTAFCGGKCTNTQSDTNHCGACGTLCNSNEACQAGKCVANGCNGSLRKCNGKCTETQSDINHCGLCNKACSPGMLCLKGLCTCPKGTTLCGGKCVDLQTSQDHCGVCNVVCSTNEFCRGGQCVCPSGQSKCIANAQFICVDLKTSKEHCGKCGEACDTGTICNQGTCRCASGTNCNNTCVDLQSSNDHCGGCNNKCVSPGTCVNGRCSCPVGAQECETSKCFDLQTSKQHCGGCGKACPAAQICVAGKCTCTTGKTCSGKCIDINHDPLHCGGCGKQCPGKAICVKGACTCKAPNKQCGNTCADLQTDNAHCGACRKACVSGVKCINYACRPQWSNPINGNGASTLASVADNQGNIYFFSIGTLVGNPFSPLAFPKDFNGTSFVKVNSQGKYLFATTLARGNTVLSSAIDAQGNIYVVGRINGSPGIGTFGTHTISPGHPIFIAKANAQGTWQWAIGYKGYSENLTVAVGPMGNVYVGTTVIGNLSANNTTYTPTAPGRKDMYLLKLNATNGSFKNIVQFRSTGDTEHINHISVDANQNVYVSTRFSGTMRLQNATLLGQSKGQNHDGALFKFDKQEKLQWHITMNTSQQAEMISATADSNGVLHAVARFNGAVLTDGKAFATKGGDDILIYKIGSTGTVQQIKQFGGTSSERVRDSALDNNGDLFVVGRFTGHATLGTHTIKSLGAEDIFVAKILTSKGEVQWLTGGGGVSSDNVISIALFGQDYYIVGSASGATSFGPSWPISGLQRGFILKNLP